MRKIPLFMKILVPVLIVFAAAGFFFCIMFIVTTQDCSQKESEVQSQEEYPPAKKIITYREEKDPDIYGPAEKDSLEDEVFATYDFGNTAFISYSENWDEDGLKDLCQELYSNVHGDEIYELQEVNVWHTDNYTDYYDYYEISTAYSEIRSALYNFLPEDFRFYFPYTKTSISIEYANSCTTVEDMAFQLSHEYGNYFTQYYFTLVGEAAEIENDPYFKLRYDDGYDIRYTPEDLSDDDDYYSHDEWYLYEIAAADYVYLMGSPNTKVTCEYMDTYDKLALSARDKDAELDEYFDYCYKDSFNKNPHSNILLPFPDQIEGLPELFYGAIGRETPEYTDRAEEAKGINIEVKKESRYDEQYYLVTWDKPWDGENVTYTLVGYDDEDYLEGAIKSIKGTKKAQAIFGGAVYKLGDTIHFYDKDSWSIGEFVRLRVIVTFEDGTAVVSPSYDWSFK